MKRKNRKNFETYIFLKFMTIIKRRIECGNLEITLNYV